MQKTEIKTTQLGTTGLEITRLGLGAWASGAGWEFGWGPGTLTIMVGGDEQAYARVEPVLRELGTPTHIGENGQGLVLKLAINISLAVQMLAFAEGLVLAERAGVDRTRAIEVMTQSPIG